MSYIPHTRRHDMNMASQGDGTGVTDMGVDGALVSLRFLTQGYDNG